VRKAGFTTALLALATVGCAELPTSGPDATLATPSAVASVPTSSAEARHEGYYYPRLTSAETYTARARTLEDSDRQRRLGFVSIMLGQQLDLSYPPQHVLFAKGEEAEKMIIIGFSESWATLYRARAVMAGLTSLVRQTPLFQELKVDDVFTFYDLAKLLGFKEIVLSDGRSYAHRVTIE
jgi:hypothetical protein